MAKKRISRSRKRDLERPDEFITLWTKLFRFATENRFLLSIVLGSVVALSIVVAGAAYYFKVREDQSFALLDQAMNKYQTVGESSGPIKAYQTVSSDFESIISQYSSSKGGKLARIFYANSCYNAEDYNRAVELYDQALSDFRDEPFLKNLVLASLGYAHIRQTDYPEAVKFFEMVAQAPGSAMADEALFNLGELYATMGQYEKSKDAYNKILTNHAGSMYVDMVKEKVDRQKK